jgi:3-methylcrotonyl-CoA carboxylase alpha subunit
MIEFDSQGTAHQIEIVARRPNLRLRIDGHEHDIDEARTSNGSFAIAVDGQTYHGFRFVTPDRIWIRLQNRTFVIDRRTSSSGKSSAKGALEVMSEVPGTIVSVHVDEGARVSEGDPVVTLESMKLQLTINADRNGVIAKIFLSAGATFDRGAPLFAYAKETA